MEVASDCDDHQPRVDLYESKSEQGPRQTVLKKWLIEFWCSDLARDDLITLLVRVDKENSIEFPFVCCTLFIHILYLSLFIKSHMSPLSHSPSHVHWFPN